LTPALSIPCCFRLGNDLLFDYRAQGQMSQSLPLCLWKKPEIEAARRLQHNAIAVAKLTSKGCTPLGSWFSVPFLATPDITFGGETRGVSLPTGGSYLRLIRRL